MTAPTICKVNKFFNFVRNFEVYGYGAKLINDNNNNYFNLSLNDNPDLKGLNNIKKAYQECLNLVDYNKINYNLSPLLKLIKDRIYTKYNCAKYNIQTNLITCICIFSFYIIN